MSVRSLARSMLGWVLVVFLAGCGTGGGSTSSSLPTLSETTVPDEGASTPTTVADPEQAFQDYAECMREHGVDMPDPGSFDGTMSGGIVRGDDPGEVAVVEEAEAACRPILEDVFGEFELSPEQEAEIRDQQLAFARCMRDNGVGDWPDPGADQGSFPGYAGDADEESVSQALNVCSEEVYGIEGNGDGPAAPGQRLP